MSRRLLWRSVTSHSSPVRSPGRHLCLALGVDPYVLERRVVVVPTPGPRSPATARRTIVLDVPGLGRPYRRSWRSTTVIVRPPAKSAAMRRRVALRHVVDELAHSCSLPSDTAAVAMLCATR